MMMVYTVDYTKSKRSFKARKEDMDDYTIIIIRGMSFTRSSFESFGRSSFNTRRVYFISLETKSGLHGSESKDESIVQPAKSRSLLSLF
jgi:hypothetical protein